MDFASGLRYLLTTKQSDLTVRQLAVLQGSSAAPATVRGLAAVMKVNKPAVTRAVDKLVDLGLMNRKRDPADARSVFLSLTKKGDRLVRELVG